MAAPRELIRPSRGTLSIGDGSTLTAASRPPRSDEAESRPSASARKRIRQNASHRARNRWTRSGYRQQIKDFRELVLHGSVDDAEKKLGEVYKTLDQAASTPALHKNTASRYKSRLAAKLNEKKSAASA